ncbi:MAG TPA: hypothetical protein VMZ90_13060 [Vicinamibacterales bacterium]|nr:hypothetical protein [Vicinamibacterales bacterium]
MHAVNRSPFYPWMAIALSAVVVLGFSRTYYLRFLSDLPPMTALVHLHGLVFTAWLALFIAQTRLVAAHRIDLHMKLGIAGVALAAIITAVGLWTVVVGAATPRIRVTGLTNTQHTLVGLTSIAMFSAFVALGVATRRQGAVHKRYMVLAMVAILSPATARIMIGLGVPRYATYFVPAMAAAFVIACMVYDWKRYRVVHPAYVIGGAVIVASWPWRYMAARQDWYQPIGEWIARIGAGIS